MRDEERRWRDRAEEKAAVPGARGARGDEGIRPRGSGRGRSVGGILLLGVGLLLAALALLAAAGSDASAAGPGVSGISADASGAGEAFDALLAAQARREALEGAAEALASRLAGEGGSSSDPLVLWGRLTAPGDPGDRAAAGVALTALLFPEGDPERYDEVAGMALPRQIPLPLMAADAVLLTASLLSTSDDPAAGALALDLLTRFARSDRARGLYFRVAPSDLAPTLQGISRSTGLPLPPDFPSSLWVVGSLPLARAASLPIPLEVAQMNGWVMLDAQGRPGQGGGASYAWDRAGGAIYPIDTLGLSIDGD